MRRVTDQPPQQPPGDPWAAPDAAYPGTSYLPRKRGNAGWIVALVAFVVLVPCALGLFGLGLFVVVFDPGSQSATEGSEPVPSAVAGSDPESLATGDCFDDSFLSAGDTIADGGIVDRRSCRERHRFEAVGTVPGFGEEAFRGCTDQVAAIDAPWDLSAAAYAVTRDGERALVCVATRTDGKRLRAPLR